MRLNCNQQNTKKQLKNGKNIMKKNEKISHRTVKSLRMQGKPTVFV